MILQHPQITACSESGNASDDLMALRQKIADLEARLKAQAKAVSSEQRTPEGLLTSILDTLDGIVWSQDAGTMEVLYLNPAAENIYGYPVSAFYEDQDLWLRMLHPEDAARVYEYLPRILADGTAEIDYRIVRADGQIRWLHDRGRLVRDESGKPLRIDGIATDITARIQAEGERLERLRQEDVIRAQEATLRELSTPLIPISDTVVVMPLIGAIDSRRAQQIMETLLAGVAAQQARVAIIDITGVAVVDTQVADMLLRVAQAVKLLGAHVMLSGLRPEVAQTLVALQVDLRGIITHSTLQRSIAVALADIRQR